MVLSTDAWPGAMFGPRNTNRLGKPASAVPRYALGGRSAQCEARLRPAPSNTYRATGGEATSNPVPKQTYLTINGPGLSNVQSLAPSGDKINAGEWIDYGGSKALGNPIANFPDEGTITIDTR